MRLGKDDLNFFQDNGFLVIQDVVPKETMDSLRQRIESVVIGEIEIPDSCFQVADPSRYKGPGSNGEVFGIQCPSQHDPVFRAFVENPDVVSVAAQLLGSAAVLFTDQVIRKLPGFGANYGAATHFHQDNQYWRQEKPTINFWYAVDDSESSNGGMRFIPGSHTAGLLDHETYWDEPVLHDFVSVKPFTRWGLPLSVIDESLQVSTPLKSGSCVAFTTTTFHASWPNTSKALHRAYGVAFQRD